VAEVVLDGIRTNYEIVGDGAPLLMYAPGGFDATLEKWRTQSVYARTRLLDHLAKAFRCIIFDRRECGSSGGRVEVITWQHYVAQGKALLDHLGVRRAHLMGGCMGCSPVMAFATEFPDLVASMVLYWPVGGAKYRMRGEARFAEHLDFVRQSGLQGVVSHVLAERKSFAADARGGPWASVLSRDAPFAAAFVRRELSAYEAAVKAMGEALFDRDTSPGAEPEDLMKLAIPALIVPGRDESHATSAARYLEECLPKSEYWDVLPDAQVEATAPPRLLDFLRAHP
jgi:pimeloyl-ACP methyl ester carboxylesterase